jgi:O-antigen/teichoic acid export membrane protein
MATQAPELPALTSAAPGRSRSFASGARVLSIGIASTGLFTFAYLAAASHVLDKSAYSRISLCWSIMFVILSVIYRPIEQLLSRTIAERHARGESASAVLRTPALIQATFAASFVVVALALRHTLTDRVFGGSRDLYLVLVIGVVAYAASYFARGWLAGNRRFALYGALVFLESTSRFLFALAAAVGISSGLNAVAAGIAAAPFVSLCVIPFAFKRVRGHGDDVADGDLSDDAVRGSAESRDGTDNPSGLSLRHGSHFAAAVVAIMLSEQALMNAGVIAAAASTHFDLTSGLTGFVFNVMLIVRAPLQLFQAVQTSILPHLTGMAARDSIDEFRRTIRRTSRTTLGFGLAVALGLLLVGPAAMKLLVGDRGFAYGRLGLAAVGLGMGLHLTAGTFNQALLARGRASLAASAWLAAAAAFVAFVALPTIANVVTRTEVGYLGATALLVLSLWIAYRSPTGRVSPGLLARPRTISSAAVALWRPARLRSPYLYMAIAALTLALVSMLSHATPSYDPWSWLIWGREILHGSLSTQDGPTWKPLPVLFTTVFALFGNLQPNLWLIVARTGFFLSVLMTFKVAARLVVSLQDRREGMDATDNAGLVRFAPPLLAGLAAATGVCLAGGYASDSALGYSEGLAVAFMLIGADRALDGHHRQAFLAGIVVAWDRPESWIVWGPYGLWLLWKDPGARKLVVGAALLTLLAWFLPQKLGGGSFSSGVARAHKPRSNSAAFGSFPFWDEFRYHAWDSVFPRAKLVAGLGIVASLIVCAGACRKSMRVWLQSRPRKAALLIGSAGTLGLAWWALIALETQAGFSGNDRYLVFGSTLVYVCEGASLGWAAVVIGRRLSRLGRSRRIRPAPVALAVTMALALAYAFLPSGWIGGDLVNISALRYQLHYQARLRGGFESLIARAGGYKEVNACGRVMVGDFQVPMAAWYLHLPIDRVQAPPAVNTAGEAPIQARTWPATVFQNGASPKAAPEPLATTISGWQRQGAQYKVSTAPDVTMYQDCGK